MVESLGECFLVLETLVDGVWDGPIKNGVYKRGEKGGLRGWRVGKLG